MSEAAPRTRTRREFFADAARLAGSARLTAALLASVEQASAIEPAPGSNYLDAEHIVVLMQENRSFDHAFGTLRGVRGFNDPRAVTLPNGNPVWLQSNAAGETYAPFRLNIRETNATWLGSLPHSWQDQSDAHNHGNGDKWLDAKPSSHRDCAGMPLTLGYYNRDDLPFYYALADAFTVCDQNFCSSLTGTTPNRLFLFTGTLRAQQDTGSVANVRNSDVDYDSEVKQSAKWTTFPERLEDAGVSWKIYQNEISLPSGLTDEEDAWLTNFTDNPLEWFEQYHVRFSKTFRTYAKQAVVTLPGEIAELDRKISTATGKDSAMLIRQRKAKQKLLVMVEDAGTKFTDEEYGKLPLRELNLHEKAFSTNSGDPDWRQLTTLRYPDGATEREIKVPKGDVLHQFRKDVEAGELPTVSWLVPPENFSDHPGAPWYGAWMVSEVMNILTHKPEVWKKTIFILNYDENDGYFDHAIPFTAPDPHNPETGRTSEGIASGVDYWPLERDRERKPAADARGGPVGLGFRVPMVVASPWSRGGYVCSQVFDHTSVLQLMENVLSRKPGGMVKETNISAWRRAVCGDMSSVFRPASVAPAAKLEFPSRDAVVESIHKARFKPLPSGYKQLAWMPHQETGVRPSLPLPYQLYAAGKVNGAARAVEIVMEAGTELFGAQSAGSPFHVYTPGQFRKRSDLRTRAYAVEAGKRVTDSWDIDGFTNGLYHLCIAGPNGFLRELAGSAEDPLVEIRCDYLQAKSKEAFKQPTGDLEIIVTNRETAGRHHFQIVDNAYRSGNHAVWVGPGEKKAIVLGLSRSFSWYDFTVKISGHAAFARRCAGRAETTRPGYSDPAMSGKA